MGWSRSKVRHGMPMDESVVGGGLDGLSICICQAVKDWLSGAHISQYR